MCTLRFGFLCLAVSILISACTASAGDYYVDVNTGDDANTGLSPDYAWKTITHATHVAKESDEMPFVIHVAPGIYSPDTGEDGYDCVTLQWTNIIGAGAEKTIIDMQEAPVSPIHLHSDCLLSGVTITRVGGVALEFRWHAYRIKIQNCIIRENDSGIHFADTEDVEFVDCIIENNGEAIRGYTVSGSIRIERCHVRGNLLGCIISGGPEIDPSVVVDSVFADNGPLDLLVLLDASEHCLIKNCLFTTSTREVLTENYRNARLRISYYLPSDFNSARAIVENCTFLGTSSGYPQSCLGIEFYDVLTDEVPEAPSIVSDCIFWDSGGEIWEEEPGMLEVHNSCIEGGWDGLGEGNFDADPLFVTGALGEYYLSQTAAGQPEDSPCVDAGSILAVEAGVADKTTRTDGSPDTGVVDIGYHYPTLFMLPEVWVSTPSDTYRHGDTLELVFEAINPNPFSYPVDLYAAIITAHGVIWTIDATWAWSASLNPWFASLELPPNFTFGPATLLTIELPSYVLGRSRIRPRRHNNIHRRAEPEPIRIDRRLIIVFSHELTRRATKERNAMQKEIAIIISLAILLVPACTASATDYYVDVNTGDDLNTGLSPWEAWKTLTHAVEAAEGGTPENVCTLHIAPGTYCRDSGEHFPIRIENDYVHLLGADPYTTVIDAHYSDIQPWYKIPCIWVARSGKDNVKGCSVEGLSITGGGTWDRVEQGCGLTCAGVEDLVIRNNKFFGNSNEYMWGGALYVDGENVLIENNEIFDNYDNTEGIESAGYDGAIYVWSGSCLIRNNYIHDNNCAAINATEGYDPVIILRDNILENNVLHDPQPGYFLGEDRSLAGSFDLVENCLITGSCRFYRRPDPPLIRNCLFVGDANLNNYPGYRTQMVIEYTSCTFASDAAPQVTLIHAFGKFANCIFSGSDRPLALESNYVGASEAELSYCRIPDAEWASLPTNFDADPLFVSGPLGDYYLSQTAAGQDADSPCVDVGSMTAAEAGMDMRTTRTDEVPDRGTVDIGYHYRTLFMLPEVWVSTPSDTYSHGDTLEMVFEAINPNPYSYPVDLYAAIITADGVIWTIDSGWSWSASLNPWFALLELPANFTFGPATLLTIELPSGMPPISDAGTYWVAAAFAHVGTTSFIGEPSLSAFELVGD